MMLFYLTIPGLSQVHRKTFEDECEQQEQDGQNPDTTRKVGVNDAAVISPSHLDPSTTLEMTRRSHGTRASRRQASQAARNQAEAAEKRGGSRGLS